jgi:pimeloyl-ACP methyl ester carboxylesterase
MPAVGLERAAFLGNSMGCQIIAQFAVRHPDRIERAVLQGPTTDPEARTWHQQFWRWIKKMRHEKREQTPVNLREYRDAGVYRVFRSLQMSFFEDRIEEQLPRMSVPTLVVRGSRDTIVPQRWAEEVVRLLPMGRLAVPGALHTMNFQQPRELVQVSLPFLLESRMHQVQGRAA